MLRSFTHHPSEVGETYGSHMATAWGFGLLLLAAGAACLIHGIFPFAFETTASRCVKRLNRRMANRAAASESPIEAAPYQPA
ncbi:MAG: hypothetical protein E7812_10980 [Phenylobacterium sp.]|nr:MAG: hypothetical protein E7812_10980 [Phenylobacterium sp.]